MGLGKHIGFGARLTQNNSNDYFNGNFNASFRGVHIALLGDPTLEMIPVKPVKNVKAISQDGKVLLTWNASPDANSYEIYKIDTVNRNYIPVNTSGDCEALLSDTFFIDECNWVTGNYIYGVAAANNTHTPSGIYVNRSLLSLAEVIHTNSITNKASSQAVFYPNPTNSYLYIRSNKIKSGTWKVRELSGRLVKTLNSLNLSEGIELSGLENGLYLVSLSNLEGNQTEESWIIVSQ
jgi:hypothetical protein